MRHFVWIVACLCIAPTAAWAQTDMNDSKNNRRLIEEMKQRLDSLKKQNQELFNNSKEIEATEKRLEDFKTSCTDYAQTEAKINSVTAEIEKQCSAAGFRQAQRDTLVLESLVPEVLNAPFNDTINTQALQWLEQVLPDGDDEKTIRDQDESLLRNYGAYTLSLQQLLHRKKVDLVNAKWAAQSEKWTAGFNKDLKKTGYYKTYESGSGGTIPFLTNAYDKLLEMNAKGFDNCQDDYENLLAGDTGKARNALERIAELQVVVDKEEGKVKALKDSLLTLQNIAAPDSAAYKQDVVKLNELRQKVDNEKMAELKREIEKLTDERDYYITREYFSNLRRKPYNAERLKKGIQIVNDSVETQVYKDYLNGNLDMMKKYPTYASEIADALDGPVREIVVKYSRNFANAVTFPDWVAKMHAPLTKTSYWPTYEKAKRTRDTNTSILYLNEIIREIEQMEDKGYKGCEAQFNKVIKTLRDCAAGTLPFDD